MAFLSRNLILDLLLTALAPAIWGTTYIVTSSSAPDRPFIAALLRVLPAGIALLDLGAVVFRNAANGQS